MYPLTVDIYIYIAPRWCRHGQRRAGVTVSGANRIRQRFFESQSACTPLSEQADRSPATEPLTDRSHAKRRTSQDPWLSQRDGNAQLALPDGLDQESCNPRNANERIRRPDIRTQPHSSYYAPMGLFLRRVTHSNVTK